MPCVDNVCGTGGWIGPLPGDPDNNSLLTAIPAFGGIDVSWTYPTLNPYAVAHVKLYRGTSAIFAGAVIRTTVGGNFFYDKVDADIQYYYWIEIVSVNGTVGELIGPATAVARPLIADLIEQLTGKIDAGVLATSLKNEIDRISVLETSITTESETRVTSNTAMASMVAAVQANVDSVTAVLQQEVTARVTDNSALVSMVNTAQSSMGSDLASAQTTLQTNINTVDGIVDAMYTAKVTVNGLVGGFGLHSNGLSVDAGFDVDTFWVGRTAANKRKPFMVVGDETFIDNAVINQLTADRIDARGLSIKDASGNVILAAGNTLDFATRFGANTTNLPANNATVGANSSNLNVGLGTGNKIANSGPAPGSLGGITVGSNTTGATPTFSVSFDPWRPTGQGGVYTMFPGTPANSTFCDMINKEFTRVPVIAGNRYEASAYLSAHRCAAEIHICWFNAAGTYIGENGGNTITNVQAGNDLVNWPRSTVFATAPAGAALAYAFVRSTYNGVDANPYTFASMWYFGDALVSQTVASPWSDGSIGMITAGNVSTYIENAAIQTAQIADATITTAKIANLAVGAAQIASAAITTAKIGDAQITTSKIGNLQVDTLQIAGNAVNLPFGASYTNTLTWSGSQPEVVVAQAGPFTSAGGAIFLSAYLAYSTGQPVYLRRNGSTIMTLPSAGGDVSFMDTPGAVSVTYTLVRGAMGLGTCTVNERSIFALECKK